MQEFGLCLDLGHAHCYGRPPVTEWAKRLAPYVRHVHIHDNDGHIDSHSGLSRGTVPWQECLQALACGREKTSADLTWTVECPGFDDALQSLNTIIHFMKRRTAT